MNNKMLFLILSLSTITLSSALALTHPTPMTEPRGLQAGGVQYELNKNLEIVIDIDKNEIALAKAAMNRDINPDVKAFAQKLYSDHEKNLAQSEALGKAIGVDPEASSISNKIKQEGKEGLAKLSAMNNQQFQMAYVNAMVKGHKVALSLLDKAIPNTQDPRFKQHLQMTRATVANHLKMAENLQSKLQQH